MLTKKNMSMKDETIIGLRAVKVAVKDYGGVQNVPITLDMIKVVKKSHHIYCGSETGSSKEKHKGGRKGKSRISKEKNSKRRKSSR